MKTANASTNGASLLRIALSLGLSALIAPACKPLHDDSAIKGDTTAGAVEPTDACPEDSAPRISDFADANGTSLRDWLAQPQQDGNPLSVVILASFSAENLAGKIRFDPSQSLAANRVAIGAQIKTDLTPAKQQLTTDLTTFIGKYLVGMRGVKNIIGNFFQKPATPPKPRILILIDQRELVQQLTEVLPVEVAEALHPWLMAWFPGTVKNTAQASGGNILQELRAENALAEQLAQAQVANSPLPLEVRTKFLTDIEATNALMSELFHTASRGNSTKPAMYAILVDSNGKIVGRWGNQDADTLDGLVVGKAAADLRKRCYTAPVADNTAPN